MKYRHQFRVRAPLPALAEFHAQSASMGAITPPPISVRVTRAPARLREGDEMAFTMWLGPVPLKWVAHIENVSGRGFSDRQISGPFQEWTHRHTFAALSEATTEVRDEVQARLRKQSSGERWAWPCGWGCRCCSHTVPGRRAACWKAKLEPDH